MDSNADPPKLAPEQSGGYAQECHLSQWAAGYLRELTMVTPRPGPAQEMRE